MRSLNSAVFNFSTTVLAIRVQRKNSMDGIDPSFECSVFAVCIRCFTRRDRGVKLPRHPPSLPLCNSFHDGRGPCAGAGSVERTGARAVAESLSAVTALARVPVMAFGVRAFPHANEKFSDLTPNVAAHPERVTQIHVTARYGPGREARTDRMAHPS